MESCETCQKFWVDQTDVELQLGTDNEPIPRGKGFAPEWTDDLCKICKKTELGLEDWTSQSLLTFDHYSAMKQVGASEIERNDPRVRRNAVLIADAIRIADRALLNKQITEVMSAIIGS